MALYVGKDRQHYWSARADLETQAEKRPVRLFRVNAYLFDTCNILGIVLGVASLLMAGAALALMAMGDPRCIVPALGACFLPVLTCIIMLWLCSRPMRFQGRLRLLRPQPLGYVLFYQAQLLGGALFMGFILWMAHRPEAGRPPDWWFNALLGLMIAECLRSSFMHLYRLRRALRSAQGKGN
ncbi:hypothetical protein [Niveispirillum sp. KHB5.9]|uniref:hypothetical protein n=1 Tax=Niveispirillum sp. KHB5.9 TaxID=3400269 RepID=UPI003A8ACF3C